MSASLGRANLHDFDTKATSAAKAGFKGLEIFYEDLEGVAKKDFQTSTPSQDEIINAAEHIRKTCTSLDLEIIGLQPFLFYDGLLNREKHPEHIEKIKFWFRIVKVLETRIIQIPANFLPADQLSGDYDVIAGDLRELADLGLREQPPVSFAYENLCWSTHIDTWEKAWDICKRVDRPNFGLCLDTFNIAGRVWADPAAESGRTPNADEDLASSVRNMVKEIDIAKIFYIQVVDAERMRSPLVEGHAFYAADQPARMSWSRNARTFIYEDDRGAYMPVESIARAIVEEMGYKGWISMELFSRTMSEEGDDVPMQHAQRGIAAWQKLEERLQLKQ